MYRSRIGAEVNGQWVSDIRALWLESGVRFGWKFMTKVEDGL